jgi:hypothetical protein
LEAIHTTIQVPVVRFVTMLFRRFATCLAVVAALSFVLDGAFGAHHHLLTAEGTAVHPHPHGSVGASDHGLADHHVADHQDGGSVASLDVAASDRGSSPVSTSDACYCCCTCHAGALLPDLCGQTIPFILLRSLATAHRGDGDGIVPDGLRRPPRLLVIA